MTTESLNKLFVECLICLVSDVHISLKFVFQTVIIIYKCLSKISLCLVYHPQMPTNCLQMLQKWVNYMVELKPYCETQCSQLVVFVDAWYCDLSGAKYGYTVLIKKKKNLIMDFFLVIVNYL